MIQFVLIAASLLGVVAELIVLVVARKKTKKFGEDLTRHISQLDDANAQLQSLLAQQVDKTNKLNQELQTEKRSVDALISTCKELPSLTSRVSKIQTAVG